MNHLKYVFALHVLPISFSKFGQGSWFHHDVFPIHKRYLSISTHLTEEILSKWKEQLFQTFAGKPCILPQECYGWILWLLRHISSHLDGSQLFNVIQFWTISLSTSVEKPFCVSIIFCNSLVNLPCNKSIQRAFLPQNGWYKL